MPDIPHIDMPAIAPALEAAESRALQAASLAAEKDTENRRLRDELNKLTAELAKAETGANDLGKVGGTGGMKPKKLKPADRDRFKEIDEQWAADPRKKRSMVDYIDYAFNHLDDDDAAAIEAPSRGDWTMLFAARCNRTKFLEKFVPMLNKRQEDAGPAINQGGFGVTEDDEGLHIVRLRAELAAAAKASKKLGG